MKKRLIASRGPRKQLPMHLYLNFSFDNITGYNDEEIMSSAELAVDELFCNFCLEKDYDIPEIKYVTNIHHQAPRESDMDYDEYNCDVKMKMFNDDTDAQEAGREDDTVFDNQMATEFMSYIQTHELSVLDNTIISEDFNRLEIK